MGEGGGGGDGKRDTQVGEVGGDGRQDTQLGGCEEGGGRMAGGREAEGACIGGASPALCSHCDIDLAFPTSCVGDVLLDQAAAVPHRPGLQLQGVRLTPLAV